MRKVTVVLTMALLLVVMALGAVGQAQTGGNVEPPGIEGEQIGEQVPAPEARDTGTLPFTGADLTLFVVIGLGAIGVGAMIVRRTRRSNPSEA